MKREFKYLPLNLTCNNLIMHKSNTFPQRLTIYDNTEEPCTVLFKLLFFSQVLNS